MPPFGLYQIPRSHVYGNASRVPSPQFNSMDFADDDEELAPAAVEETVDVEVDRAASKEERRARKKARKLAKQVKESAPAAVEDADTVENDTVAETIELKERNKTQPAHAAVKEAVAEEVKTVAEKKEPKEKKTKKRKRVVDTAVEIPAHQPVADDDESFGFGPAWMEKFQKIAANIKLVFDAPEDATTSVDDQSKKKKARKSQLDKPSPSITISKPKLDSPETATTPGDDQPKKKARKSQPDKPSPYATAPKMTPVPLPSNTPRTASKGLPKTTARSLGSPQRKGTRDGRSPSEVLVTATPPSQMPKSNGMSSPISSSLSPRKSNGKSTSPAPGRSSQPKDIPPKVSHEEADFAAFKKAFHASRDCVNFFDELAYLEQHKARRAENEAAGPLPCLKSITGCNPKGEQMLGLAKDTPSDLLRVLVHSEEDQATFDAAVQAGLEAEKFLHATILTSTPVPLRNMPGQYTLYCPKYSATHIDKYGNGQRTINISRPAGARTNSYTARLSIPPRSIPYTTLLFTAPPHASFRTTELTTVAEGFTMTIAFLGNGYILLRLDLGLFLRGKETEMKGGQNVCMEFVGVKEKDDQGDMALQWPVAVPIVEKVIDDEVPLSQMSATAMDTPTPSVEPVVVKKKRGRPSNAELARRAAVEKAAQEGTA